MSCMTLFAQETAMTTTQLTHVACQNFCVSWPAEQHTDRRVLRRSWVVVTDENGKRVLRSRWDVTSETPIIAEAAKNRNNHGGENE